MYILLSMNRTRLNPHVSRCVLYKDRKSPLFHNPHNYSIGIVMEYQFIMIIYNLIIFLLCENFHFIF